MQFASIIKQVTQKCTSHPSGPKRARYFRINNQSHHSHAFAGSPIATTSTCIRSGRNQQHSALAQDRSIRGACKANTYWNEANLRDDGIFDERDLLKFKTLHELQVNASIAFSKNKLFGTHTTTNRDDGITDATFEWMTFGEYGEQVDQCRSVLKDLGVKEFSKVGIISNNCWEWATIAAATYSLNATLVPMYEAQLSSDWTYITNDSECAVLFCATKDIFDRAITEVVPQTPSVMATLCLKAEAGEPYAFQTHMEAAADRKEGKKHVIAPSPDDLANLIYTSGTTGKPKGVELIHSNTVSNVTGVREMAEDVHDFIRQSDRSLAFLPWAHS